MPYAMLTQALPKDKVGVMMGMFNLFIVIPQVIASSLLGKVIEVFFGGKPMYAMIIGGVCFAIASLTTIFVVTYKKNPSTDKILSAVTGH
jgi:maltose/moltooligosaccharide transporter